MKKLPKLNLNAIKRAVKNLPAKLEQMRQDEEDKLSLSGKFAPVYGTCIVCKNKVIAKVSYPHTGMIGGPRLQSYVSGWECEGCGLLYGRMP
jgi:uncharacterized protein with PIN domain